MAAMDAGRNFVGKDSGQDYGDTELLEGLIAEVNSTLERLSEVGLQGQEGVQDSESVLHMLPRAEMEDLAQRVSAIESLLLDAN